MKAEHVDERGNKKEYEISYSQTLQEKTLKAIKLNNWLLYVLIFLLFIASFISTMIWKAGYIGNALRPLVCGV